MASWALISGKRGEGKTSLALRLVARLREAGLRVDGFVQRALEDAEGTRTGYDLVRLGTGETVPLARRGAPPADDRPVACHYIFDPAAFGRARAWLRDGAAPAPVLLLDEIGRLEAAGGGHADAVHLALAQPDPTVVILSVRAELLFPAVYRFLGEQPVEPVAALEAPATPAAEEEFVRRVVRAVGAGGGRPSRRVPGMGGGS